MNDFVLTNDGSPTLFDPVFGEHHHSLIGAYTEARFKFAEIAKPLLEAKAKVRILDLPFGLGYNFIATLDLVKELPSQTFIECLAIEKDFSVIQKIANCPFPEKLLPLFADLKPLASGQRQIETTNYRLELLVEDLVLALPNRKEPFDLIYYDPFSPRVAPELWSGENVLRQLVRLLTKEGLLITYTASNKVRKGLLELGLNIAPGSAVGRKMPGTIASKSPLTGQFSVETWQKIQKTKSY